jgi:hypothetical protein
VTQTIVGVAIRRRDGLILSMPAPARHNDVLRRVWHMNPNPRRPVRGIQGFLTSDGLFVDRRDAMKIARVNGQLRPGSAASKTERLFSEDLW